MAVAPGVAAGQKGKLTLWTSGASSEITIAEMGAWTISGPTLNMITHSAFGDERGRQKPGVMTGQTVAFDGYADFSTEEGIDMQTNLLRYLSSGTPIHGTTHMSAGSSAGPSRFRLWACDDSSLAGYGWWQQGKTTRLNKAAKSFITGLEVGQNMDGVGTIAFTMAFTGGNLVWHSSAST